MKTWLGALAATFAGSAAAQTPGSATPLFAADAPIAITIKGPISTLTSKRSQGGHPGTLTHAGVSYPITLSPRGITRRQKDVCPFPPLRVDFAGRPPEGSLFAGQNRLKLVTHCRNSVDFQQKVLLEYSAYRIYNLLTPLSFRARLANIDYVDDSGKAVASRVGFFIEDIDDVAARNGMTAPAVGRSVPTQRLDPTHSSRVALFEYLIGNLDWSTRAGPEGDRCCHNSRLIGRADGPLVPVPYDFDFSGLVGAPYAVPPDIVPVSNVRSRYFRGFCVHNPHVPAIAAEFRARRPQLISVLSQIPQLDARTRARAAAYLGDFFADIADDRSIARKLLRTCID